MGIEDYGKGNESIRKGGYPYSRANNISADNQVSAIHGKRTHWKKDQEARTINKSSFCHLMLLERERPDLH